jgi:hypothetical protein
MPPECASLTGRDLGQCLKDHGGASGNGMGATSGTNDTAAGGTSGASGNVGGTTAGK